jgi:hypothetical protein
MAFPPRLAECLGVVLFDVPHPGASDLSGDDANIASTRRPNQSEILRNGKISIQAGSSTPE